MCKPKEEVALFTTVKRKGDAISKNNKPDSNAITHLSLFVKGLLEPFPDKKGIFYIYST
jgi:hypothetical protein